MSKAIHAFSIAYYDRHHVRRRCSRVDPETLKLRMEVIGVLPKLGAQFRLSRAEFQRFENGRNHYGRQRT